MAGEEAKLKEKDTLRYLTKKPTKRKGKDT